MLNCRFKRSFAAISVSPIPLIDLTLHAGMSEVALLLYLNMHVEGLTIDSTHGQ
jgi:hypothetical protein